MKKNIRNEVAVGITVTIVLVLTIYVVTMLADWPGLFTTYQKITVRLPYKVGLRGLTRGSLVNLGGVKIGQITNTGIEELQPGSIDNNDVHVFFTMKIPQQYHLRHDCVLMSQGNLLGGIVYEQGFISFSSFRDRSEKGGICLKKDMGEGYPGSHILYLVGIFIGNSPRD